MNPVTIGALATAFKVTAYAAGAPSLAMLVFYGFHTLQQRAANASPASSFGDNPDALMLILQGTVKVLETVGKAAAALEQIVFDILAAAAAVGLVTALVCGVIGQGLQSQAAWARWSAFAMLALLLLVSLLGVLSLRDFGRVTMLAIVTLSALGLHALWGGYSGLR